MQFAPFGMVEKFVFVIARGMTGVGPRSDITSYTPNGLYLLSMQSETYILVTGEELFWLGMEGLHACDDLLSGEFRADLGSRIVSSNLPVQYQDSKYLLIVRYR